MTRTRYTRPIMTVIVLLALTLALIFAFRPQPVLVDLAAVQRGEYIQTIDEEARTRVHEAYVVSAPITGRLLRIELEAGDKVEQGLSLVMRMLPSRPPALDVRQLEQSKAAVKAAQAALTMARANHQSAQADHRLAQAGLDRAKKQIKAGNISQALYDQAVREAEASDAALENTLAQMALRDAELANARAAFLGLGTESERPTQGIEIHAPVSGSILQVFQESETIVAAGTPILEIGDIQEDLEVVVELLSSDAVRVRPGDPVIIDNWGGEQVLHAVVDRIDPLGFTKISTLGVEEQRVNTRIHFTDLSDAKRTRLGHGFRVEARIIVEQIDDALIVPASALYRDNGQWSVFLVEDGVAQARHVSIASQNGQDAVVEQGLAAGNRVVLYPSPELENDVSLVER